jgi:hypothetical protein
MQRLHDAGLAIFRGASALKCEGLVRVAGGDGLGAEFYVRLAAARNNKQHLKERVMMRTIIGGLAAAALALTGMAAHAGCVDPRVTNSSRSSLKFDLGQMTMHGGQNASENIVGTWHVVYEAGGNTTGEAFIQWHRDGTEWENIDYPVLGGNICMGSWTAVDRSHVYRNHYGWLYNNGLISGYFNEVETDEVSWDGNSYTGVNTTTLNFYPVAPATTPTVIVLSGTASATRIAP